MMTSPNITQIHPNVIFPTTLRCVGSRFTLHPMLLLLLLLPPPPQYHITSHHSSHITHHTHHITHHTHHITSHHNTSHITYHITYSSSHFTHHHSTHTHHSTSITPHITLFWNLQTTHLKHLLFAPEAARSGRAAARSSRKQAFCLGNACILLSILK